MQILYVQTIRMDTHLCRTSRLEMIRELVTLGHRVTFIAGYERERPHGEPWLETIWIRALRVPYLSQLLYTLTVHARVFRLLAGRPIDVVILDPYTVHCAFPFDILARLGRRRLRVVLDVRSGIFHARHRPIGNLLLRVWRRVAFAYARRLFTGFTTISPRLRDTLVQRFGIPRARVGIWQSGVRLSQALPAPTLDELMPRDRFVVMYHGTFGTDRGLEQAVGAMRLIRDTAPSVLLFLLGNGTEEARIRAAARGLDNVVFHPAVPQSEVSAFVERCDVGIMPFLPTEVMRSSSPLKLMEYLAAGKPVIVSRIEAFTDVLGDTPGAIYLDEPSDRAIAEAIRFALAHREALPEWGRPGREIVQQRYTWERQAVALAGFLEALG